MHDHKLGPISLSKREHFAALFFAGMCANFEMKALLNFGDLAELAIVQADVLIDRLASTNGAASDPECMALGELPEEFYRPSDATEIKSY